jgi:hypothetical protein
MHRVFASTAGRAAVKSQQRPTPGMVQKSGHQVPPERKLCVCRAQCNPLKH